MGDNAILYLALAVVAFLLLRDRLGLGGNSMDVLEGAPPPRAKDGSLDKSLGAAIGAGACVAGASALGSPQLGGQLAPACAALGAFAAPYVKKGIIFGAEKTAEGAKWVASETAQGTKWALKQTTNVLTNPAAVVFAPTNAALKVTSVAANGLEKLGNTWDKAPTLVKVATAPIAVSVKTTQAAISKAQPIVSTVTKVAESGVKAATSAVSSVANKALGWL